LAGKSVTKDYYFYNNGELVTVETVDETTGETKVSPMTDKA